ncbi:MAG: hypothetical protein HC867_05365 [Bacteroidia bacterium]|nr:hypothetical protein [Bacteroidia bacterium]
MKTQKKLLQSLEVSGITVAGDTRFDRVSEIAEKSEPLPLIENLRK